MYVESGIVRNSIVYFNTASTKANWYNGGGSFDHSCTTPDPGGVGNIGADPRFVDGTNGNYRNYRLAPTSPCIDAGVNEPWMVGATDLDGNPRIFNETVDLGAWDSTHTIVNPSQNPPVRFARPLADNGVIRTTIKGLPEQGTCIIERSTDLIEWQPIQTNTITRDSFELVEPISPSSPHQFFRAIITSVR